MHFKVIMQAQKAYTSIEREEIESELTKDFSDMAGELVKVKYLNYTAFIECESELGALRIFKKYSDFGRCKIGVYYNQQLRAWIVQIKSSTE